MELILDSQTNARPQALGSLLVVIILLICPQIGFAHDTHAHPWGYEGGTDPSHWGEMEKDHQKHLMCREGTNQSPIDIDEVRGSRLAVLGCHYLDTPIRITNNGHTIHLGYNKGSYVDWGDQKFYLIQFHFHHPSEHLIHGQSYAMEMHLVHKTSDHQYVVIGVFMKEGKFNPQIQQLWDRIPKDVNKEIVYKNEEINLEDFLPKTKEYFHYYGSLTTPPCSENVSWFLLKTPIEISKAQIESFKKVIDHNARPAQKLNHRVIVKIN